jgi:hypothetical protein
MLLRFRGSGGIAEPILNLDLLDIFHFAEISMRRLFLILAVFIALPILLAACGSTKDPAAQAVEKYITALSSKDANTLSLLSCADWEPSARLEFDSFQAVKTRLEGLKCALSGTDGDTRLVLCQGKLLATYNGEDQTFDLSARTYKVAQQGGEYLVCGYK